MLKITLLFSVLSAVAFAQNSTTAPSTTGAAATSNAVAAPSGVDAGSVNPNLPQTPEATVSGYTIG
jgi:hypothetical protein